MAYGRNYYPDQQVFVGAQGSTAEEVKGVQSFNGSWSAPYNQMMAAGYDFVGNELEGELVGEVGVSRYIITGNDPITGLMDNAISGFLVYGSDESYDKVFNFSQGYITSYESTCSIGEIATCDFGLTAYGGIGKMQSQARSYTEIIPEAARANYINLTTDFGSTNAIQSYSLGISLDRSPVNKIGDMFAPSEFVTSLPVTANISFDVLVHDFEVENIRNIICTGGTSNIAINLNKCEGVNIRSFTLNNAVLLDSSLDAGIGSDMTVSLTYEAYYNSVTGAIAQIMS